MKFLTAEKLLVAAVFLTSQLAYSTNTVSRPVGVVRISVTPGNQVLSSLAVDPFDNRIAGIFAGQLSDGLAPSNADNVLLWNSELATFDVYWKSGGVWRKEPESFETTNLLGPGVGHWLVSRQNFTQNVFYSGDIILNETNAVLLNPSVNLMGFPFSSKIALSNTSLRDNGAYGAAAQSNADQITETEGYQQFWLLDDSNSPNHGLWVDANTNPATMDLTLARGYWYDRRITNAFTWTETRPYAHLFPNDENPPAVTSLTFNAQHDEVTLKIASTGTGERLEIYFKDLTATGALVSAPGWQIAQLNLTNAGNVLNWTDDGSGGRGKVNTVFARYYLVGASDIDSDEDTLPDARETFVYGSNPLSNDSDGDGMPDDWEIQYNLNPLLDDAADDNDFDELSNLEEYQNNTAPNDSDTDDDGMEDGWEVNNGLNPRSDLLTSGLAAHWAFDDGSGATATNSVSTNYAGTLQNFAGGWTTGLLGGALSFDGTNQYVIATQTVAIVTGGAFTITALVNLDSSFGENWPTLVSDSKLRLEDFPVAVTSIPPSWFGGVITGSGTTNTSTDGNANWSVPSNGNHQGRAVFGGTGSGTNSAKQRNSFITKPFTMAAATTNRPQEWAFNISYDSSNATGSSDENRLRVWLWSDSTNLSSANGYAVEYGEDLTNDRVRLFRMTSGSKNGTNIVSAGTSVTSGDAQHSVRIQRSILGVWRMWSTYNTSSSNSFPVSDPLTVTNDEQVGTNSAYTVAGDGHIGFQAFISTSASSSRNLALDDLSINGQITGFDLRYRNSLTALTGDATNTTTISVSNSVNPYLDRWQSLAMNYDGTNATLFVGGVAAALRAASFLPALQTQLLIGCDHSEQTNSYLKAKLDDLRIYNRALNDVEVRDLYDRVGDVDGDGVNNFDEYEAGTDPNNAASKPVSISGTISYSGGQTGSIYVLASPSSVGFPLDRSTVLSSPGAFTIPNVPTLANYWLRAFRDVNADGVVSACEARGEYASNPIYLTGSVSGASITLQHDTIAPVLSGVPGPVVAQTNILPEAPNVTANDAYEGSVSVTFGETTNSLPAFNLYLGTVGQGLNGYSLTGFTNALVGYGTRSLENFSGVTVSPPSYSNLTVEYNDITCTIEHRDDDGSLNGVLRTYDVDNPASQDGASGSGAGITESTGSSSNRNMFVFRFNAAVGHVGLDGLDIESSSTGTLATARAYDADSNLLYSSDVVYSNGANGNGEVHFVGLTSDRANVRIFTLTVGDTSGNGNGQHMAFDNLRFGSSMAPTYEIVRTWSASDSCGNGVIATQIISTVETGDPDGPTLPPDLTDLLDDTLWINEIHYDNASIDVDEGVEVAGLTGTVLTNYSLAFYSGGDGKVYKTTLLSGTINSQQCVYGTAWFAVSGIENGPADGIALVKGESSVKQFLSYEGNLTAANGPAVGLTSTPIAVSELATTPTGKSLQLSGVGGDYAEFIWIGPTNATPSTINTNQSFPCPGEGGSTNDFVEPNAWPLTLDGNPVTYEEFIEAPRQQMAAELPDLFDLMYAERMEAEAWCLSNDVPISAENEDGGWISVVKIVDNQPVYHVSCNRIAAKTVSTDKVWPGGSAGFSLTGTNTTIGLWDGGIPRTTHQEFMQGGVSRIVSGDGSSSVDYKHATEIAGTLAAAGVNTNAIGMSFSANIFACDATADRAEAANASIDNDLRISTHAYSGGHAGWAQNGTATTWRWHGSLSISTNESEIFGTYGFFAQSWDDTVYKTVYLLPVWAAGNDRLEGPTSQPINHEVLGTNGWYVTNLIQARDGVPSGFDSIYSYPLAKNVLTVGAIDDISGGYSNPSGVNLASYSGCGPTDDGRIKPDVVGNGQFLTTAEFGNDTNYISISGTSFAAPNVAGSLNLLVQLHTLQNGTNYPLWASTLKAIAIHTADESGSNLGPDYQYGWGLLNTRKAAELMRANASNAPNATNDISFPHMKEVVLLNGDFIEFGVTNMGGTSNPLRVTIAWTDPPGPLPAPGILDPTNLVLVNDLDLSVIGPGLGPTNYPWILNPNSPTAAATRGDNFRDNVEQVHIPSPTAGVYTIRVTHKGVLSNGYQNVSMIISGNKPLPISNAVIKAFSVLYPENRYIQWQSVVGHIYRVESTENLSAGTWTSHVADVSAAKTNIVIGNLPEPDSVSRMYRVRIIK